MIKISHEMTPLLLLTLSVTNRLHCSESTYKHEIFLLDSSFYVFNHLI